MKQTASILIIFFILLFVYTKLAGPLPFSVTSITTQKTDTFSVSGEGKSNTAPDIAVINVGVQVQGSAVTQAQQELNSKIDRIVAAVKKIGIGQQDIQTSNYSIYPSYDWQEGRNRITGYQANSSLTIKIREMEKANLVIDAATANGANQIGGLSFTVDDKTKAENEARQQAVAVAKKKAEEAARIAGFKLGRIINYSENFGSPERLMPLLAEAAVGKTAPTQIEPGSTEVVVVVTLSYEIK